MLATARLPLARPLSSTASNSPYIVHPRIVKCCTDPLRTPSTSTPRKTRRGPSHVGCASRARLCVHERAARVTRSLAFAPWPNNTMALHGNAGIGTAASITGDSAAPTCVQLVNVVGTVHAGHDNIGFGCCCLRVPRPSSRPRTLYHEQHQRILRRGDVHSKRTNVMSQQRPSSTISRQRMTQCAVEVSQLSIVVYRHSIHAAPTPPQERPPLAYPIPARLGHVCANTGRATGWRTKREATLGTNTRTSQCGAVADYSASSLSSTRRFEITMQHSNPKHGATQAMPTSYRARTDPAPCASRQHRAPTSPLRLSTCSSTRPCSRARGSLYLEACLGGSTRPYRPHHRVASGDVLVRHSPLVARHSTAQLPLGLLRRQGVVRMDADSTRRVSTQHSGCSRVASLSAENLQQQGCALPAPFTLDV